MEELAQQHWQKADKANPDECQTTIDIVAQTILNPNHHFVIKMKCHLIILLNITEDQASELSPDKQKSILEIRRYLSQEVINYLCKLDPGKTKKMGIFLLEFNNPHMKLVKINYDTGALSRLEFFKKVKDGAKLETMAKDMIARYTSVTKKAVEKVAENDNENGKS